MTITKVSLRHFFYLLLSFTFFTNNTIANDPESVLIHSLISPDDSLVQVHMTSHQWRDDMATYHLTKTGIDGEVHWHKSFTMAAGSRIRGMASDASGSVYMTGRFQGQLDFGGQTLRSETNKAFFLMRIGAGGELGFLKAWESEKPVTITGLQVSALGELWLTGSSELGALRAGTLELDPQGPASFWFRFDSDGTFDRILTLTQSPLHPQTQRVAVEDIQFLSEGQAVSSMLQFRDLRFEGRGSRPDTTDEEPPEDPDPGNNNGTPPPI